MKEIRFLVDADTATALIEALWRQEPGMDILRVGWPGTPPTNTLDPALLVWAEAEKRCLITQDKRTMPGHLADHFAAGHHTWGVLLLRGGFATHRYLDDLVLIWSAKAVEETYDWTDYLPW